jgi:hypothetical protein
VVAAADRLALLENQRPKRPAKHYIRAGRIDCLS